MWFPRFFCQFETTLLGRSEQHVESQQFFLLFDEAFSFFRSSSYHAKQ